MQAKALILTFVFFFKANKDLHDTLSTSLCIECKKNILDTNTKHNFYWNFSFSAFDHAILAIRAYFFRGQKFWLGHASRSAPTSQMFHAPT